MLFQVVGVQDKGPMTLDKIVDAIMTTVNRYASLQFKSDISKSIKPTIRPYIDL